MLYKITNGPDALMLVAVEEEYGGLVLDFFVTIPGLKHGDEKIKAYIHIFDRQIPHNRDVWNLAGFMTNRDRAQRVDISYNARTHTGTMRV